jgi:ribonuclease P protein component
MLKKKYRLTKLKNKESVFFRNDIFNLRIYSGDNNDPKFAFVIQKKIIKNAVLRNKTKRTLAEIIRKNIDKFSKGKEVIIILKQSLIGRENIEEYVLGAFKKARLIK